MQHNAQQRFNFTGPTRPVFDGRDYNPALDEKTNAKRLRRLQKAMSEALEAKLEAAKFYEENETLSGYKGATTFSSSALDSALEGADRDPEPGPRSPARRATGLTDAERREKFIARSAGALRPLVDGPNADAAMLAQLDELDDKGVALIKAALGTEAEHSFYVVAKEGLDEFPKALVAAWARLDAKTSDDLPRPFTMERVDDALLAL